MAAIETLRRHVPRPSEPIQTARDFLGEVGTSVGNYRSYLGREGFASHEIARIYLDGMHASRDEITNASAIFQNDQRPEFLDTEPTNGTNFVVFDIVIGGKSYKYKVSRFNSSIPGYIHPSDTLYSAWYREGIETEVEVFTQALPYFIPRPQMVWHAAINNGQAQRAEKRTLILQPAVEDIVAPKDLSKLSYDDLDGLYEELNIIGYLSEIMNKQYKMLPDLAGDFIGDPLGNLAQLFIRDALEARSNLVIAKTGEGYHFVLVDNGPADKRFQSKVWNPYLEYGLKVRLALEKGRIKTMKRRKKRV